MNTQFDQSQETMTLPRARGGNAAGMIKLAGIGVVVFAAIVFVASRFEHPREPSAAAVSSSTPHPMTAPTQLEFTHRWNWSESGNYIHIEGQVTNVSGERLEGMRIVISLADEAGNFVTSEVSYPQFDPLMPGQTSPYTSMISDNPAIKKYRVEFATRDGEKLKAADMTPASTVKKKKK